MKNFKIKISFVRPEGPKSWAKTIRILLKIIAVKTNVTYWLKCMLTRNLKNMPTKKLTFISQNNILNLGDKVIGKLFISKQLT